MKRKILLTSALFALSFSAATLSFSLEKEVKAKADETLQTSLLSPVSYEEYLPLLAPNDLSVSEEFTAIADGEKIYVYDKTKGLYHEYEHDAKVSMVQLASNTVYFLDGTADLYSISLDELSQGTSAQALNFSCVNFAVNGDSFYCRKGENIFKYPLSDVGGAGESIVSNLSLAEYTPLAFWKEEVCYFQNGELYRANNAKAIASFPYQVSSMTITGDLLALTTNGNLYAYNLNELNSLGSAEQAQLILNEKEGYTAVSSNEKELYAIHKTSVWSFLMDEEFAIDKEICLASSSKNRLNSAAALTLSGGKLFAADNGNARISVYDTASGEYCQPIFTEIQPSFLASYGKSLLAASPSQAILYSLDEKEYGKEAYLFDTINGSIVGVTAVYDKYYILTNTNHCYVFQSKNGEWTAEEHVRKTAVGTLLTSDVYGYLYITTNTGVYRYTENAFLDSNGVGEEVLSTLPASQIKEIAVDYDRNIYLLGRENLFKYTAETQNGESFSFGSPLVYKQTPYAISFALGADNNTAYLLFEGDYIAKTSSLRLPAMSTLPTENAYEQMHAANMQLQLCSTLPGSVLIEFSMQNFTAESEYFPYLGFNRFVEAKQAICLARTDKYEVLTLVGEEENKTYLALLEDVIPLADDYFKEYEEEKTGYLSNTIPLFKYPTLQSNLPHLIPSLSKNMQVVITGELQLEQKYYQISFTDQSGRKIGYIPASYVSLFDGAPPISEERVYGKQSEKDSVWRLWYILLGLGMIGILIDYLLLRRKKDDKDEE